MAWRLEEKETDVRLVRKNPCITNLISGPTERIMKENSCWTKDMSVMAGGWLYSSWNRMPVTRRKEDENAIPWNLTVTNRLQPRSFPSPGLISTEERILKTNRSIHLWPLVQRLLASLSFLSCKRWTDGERKMGSVGRLSASLSLAFSSHTSSSREREGRREG